MSLIKKLNPILIVGFTMGLAFSGFAVSLLLVIVRAWLRIHEAFLLMSLAGSFTFYVILIYSIKKSIKKGLSLLKSQSSLNESLKFNELLETRK